jgi:drug/metabolite transporter (DMT)-like permease
MSWQLLISAYLLLGTAAYLLRRSLAQRLFEHNKLINGFFFLCVLYPLGLIVACFSSPDLKIGWLNLFFLLAGSVIFPLIVVMAFRANKDIDAGLYTILNNVTPIITILAATILLNETLNGRQMLGAAVIISSAFLATLPKLNHHRKNSSAGLLFALASVSLLGLAIVYERWMLTRIDYGAYLGFGGGAQTLWMTIIAWPERKYVSLLKTKGNSRKILAYGVTNAFKGLTFVSALKLSGNASLVGASSSFMAVLVVLSAYFVLKENEHLWLKIASAVIGAGGLIILNTA